VALLKVQVLEVISEQVQLSGLRGGGHKVLLGGGGPNFLQGGGGGEVVVHGGGIAAVQALASLVPIVIALPRCTILKQKEYFLNICQIFLAKIGHPSHLHLLVTIPVLY